MLAAIGLVAQHYIKFPGFEKVRSGVFAPNDFPANVGWIALIIFLGWVELVPWKQDPKKEIGDFGDPLGLNMYDDDMRNKELNNGRFAMFAAMGIIMAEVATGKTAMQQIGF